MEILNYIIIILLGYLIGSIPFALIIGKGFYNTDIRKSGSGNLGGTNAGRTLGRKAGIAVMVLDILKAFFAIILAVALTKAFNMDVDPKIAGLAAVFGHSYPIFAGFRGGKGVACAAGYLLATNPLLLLVGIIILLINLRIHHMVSLGVIITLVIVAIISYFIPIFESDKYSVTVVAAFIIFQHRSNIKRIINGTENKVTWI